MKLKTFLIVFVSFVVVLSCSAAIIFLQMQAMKGVRLELLEDKLYTENASILSWAMKNMDIGRINPAGMPSSWGEIMVVDNESLTVSTSTNRKHAGMQVSTIPELLDQAAPVLAAVAKRTDSTVKTRDYTIVLTPYAQGSTLIGLKPKSWEKGLISGQSMQLQQGTASALRYLIGYLAAGLVFALVLSLVIAFVAASPITKAARAFEDLSLGNFDADLPRTGGKTLVSLSDSFFRLKTSLMYAMEKLGRG
ncbi:MAG TPA: hypothetical protein PKM41_12745 [Deltaproteobacteria bacterium]|jgi:HAMP domain-containing protein|nr:hypothetical protein [Deltaproteobacteria bacterium]HOI07925.1 hypothetical protein [Deltaproteobacteria bacterium]